MKAVARMVARAVARATTMVMTTAAVPTADVLAVVGNNCDNGNDSSGVDGSGDDGSYGDGECNIRSIGNGNSDDSGEGTKT